MEQFADVNVVNRVPHGGGGVMVWVTDNEHNCIVSMAIWMQRDTVMRSWGPLSCHSSPAIPSCFRIMHCTMSQGSVHSSWKLKIAQFFHGHTHQTCHPLSMFGMLWINVYDSVFQLLPISSNFAQPFPEVSMPIARSFNLRHLWHFLLPQFY